MKKYKFNQEHSIQQSNGTDRDLPEVSTVRQSRRNRKQKAFLRKASALALSAVLFGGLAAGTFQGVNMLIESSTQTSSNGTSGSSSLLNASEVSTTSGTSKGSLDVSDIAEAAMPSIVSITNQSVQEVQNYFNTFGYNYQQPQLQETESCGSGIIIGQNDTELLIVTNYHVVENADTLSVSFIDNQVCEASLKGMDSTNDLAVIAVSLDNISSDTLSSISTAVIGDSDSLKVGEQVVAIGNALGYGQSVTTGIVSATNRTISSSDSSSTDTESTESTESSTYIQTDAAINPGNSGGALLNMDGELIGINIAKLSSTEIEGMGYAIPISRVQDIIESLMNETTKTKVEEDSQGTIGVSGRDISSDVAEAYQIPQGVYISNVSENSAAAAAGITAGSILTSFDGNTVTSVSDLQSLLQYYPAGSQVEVTLMVPDQSSYTEKTITITLGSADSSSASLA